MKILYICPLNPVLLAAAGGHVISTVNLLHMQGNDVTLLHLGPPHPDLHSTVGEVSCAIVNASLLKKIFQKIRFSFKALQLIRRESVDIVYLRFVKSEFLIPIVLRLNGNNLVTEFNADTKRDLEASNTRRAKIFMYLLIEKLNVICSRHIVVVAEGIADSLKKRHQLTSDAITTVNNGTDITLYRPLDRATCKKNLKLSDAQSYVVFAGTFQSWQGLKDLIRAFTSVVQSISDVTLILVGDGPEMASLRAMVKRHELEDKVIFAGWCTQARTAQYLGASDVCIAPYNRAAASEPGIADLDGTPMNRSPLKLYMYIAAARPVVTTNYLDCLLYTSPSPRD